MDSTRAIIINSETSGEADIFITAYTELFGKQNFIARGARRMEAKLRSDLRPYSLVELSFVGGKNNFLLTGAKEIENFSEHFTIKDFFAASVISAIIDVFISQPEKDDRLFLNILFSFRALNGADSEKKVWIIIQRFFWNLLVLQGTFILSKKCRQCASPFNYGASMIVSGELLCGRCAEDEIFVFDQEDLYVLEGLLGRLNIDEMPDHIFDHLNNAVKTLFFKEDAHSTIHPQSFSWFLELVI